MKRESIQLWPTALWVIFGPVLGCMWIAAVNYSNNLVYAILYLIAALSFISIFHTWRNLAALQVEHIRIHPAFVGETVRVEIFLRNSSKHTIYGFFFARTGEETEGLSNYLKQLKTANGKGVRLDPGDSCSTEVILPQKQKARFGNRYIIAPGSGERRGLYRFGSLLVSSSYPFGLIRASFRVPVNVDYYTYPQPKGISVWPQLRPGSEQGSPSSQRPGDDFSGVRAYMPGESLRHVDWKAFARGRPMAIKQFTGGAGNEMWLDAGEMESIPLEARLSQLALWIVAAEKEEIPYALKLGRTVLPLGLGEAHSRRALEALAVAGVGSP